MVVLGMNVFIFDITRRTCSVMPFSSELGVTENVPIVDGVISYEYQCSHQTYILIIHNELYI